MVLAKSIRSEKSGAEDGTLHASEDVTLDASTLPRDCIFVLCLSSLLIWINPIADFQLTRQDLPHMQAPGSYYFTASNTHRSQILRPVERQIVFDTIRFLNGKKYDLNAAVVMPDHFHLILKPRETDGAWVSLPDIFHAIKSFAAHEITKLRRSEQLLPSKQKIVSWQDENYDHIIRNERDYNEKFRYLVMNPVAAGLVSRPEDLSLFVLSCYW